MSENGPEPFGQMEIGAQADVIPADQVAAEQAQADKEDRSADPDD